MTGAVWYLPLLSLHSTFSQLIPPQTEDKRAEAGKDGTREGILTDYVPLVAPGGGHWMRALFPLGLGTVPVGLRREIGSGHGGKRTHQEHLASSALKSIKVHLQQHWECRACRLQSQQGARRQFISSWLALEPEGKINTLTRLFPNCRIIAWLVFQRRVRMFKVHSD